MSRWSKNRNATSYALPLDALVKEKENTNRPVAARSAGTVGKWGITSFTSIRARPVYGFASFSPNQDPSLQYSQFSPKSYVQESSDVAGNNSTPANNNTVKPKKFFKSRNSVPETNAIPLTYPDPNGSASVTSPSYYSIPGIYQQQTQSSYQTSTPPAKAKKKKKPLQPDSTSKKSKAEKIPKPENLPRPSKPQKIEKVPKTSKKNAKTIEKIESTKPTRVLSRARKVVNYSEDKSRSPTPGQNAKISSIGVVPNPIDANELVTSPIQNYERNDFFQNEEAMDKVVDDKNVSEDSSSKLPIGDHPPIVLRISKGTSRLISTDSEGISGSPPYLSPDQQNTINSQQTVAGYSSAAASLLAVLSDDPEPQDNLPISTDIASTSHPIYSDQNTSARSKRDKLRHKAEPIKLKIKTTERAHKNTSEAFEHTEEAETQRVGRVTRRTPYQPIEDNITTNTSPNRMNYQSPQLSLKNGATQQPTYPSNQSINDSESFQNDKLSTKLATLETENQNDYERGIVPKKRRVKNKVNSEVIIESTVDPIKNKKQRGRRKNDDNFTENSEIGSQSTDTQIAQALDNSHELEKEPIPKKRMTAAARKQYSLPIQQLTEIVAKPVSEKLSESKDQRQNDAVINSPKNRGRRVKSKPVMNSAAKVESIGQEEKLERQTRSTRNNANDMMQDTEQKVELSPPTRSYGRKRKLVKDRTPDAPLEPNESSSILYNPYAQSQMNIESNTSQIDTAIQNIESENVSRGRPRRQAYHHLNGNNEEINIMNNNESAPMETEDSIAEKGEQEIEKPSVKLVISKKKGSIFKSRAIDGESGESKKQKRHVYKHKWDVDDELGEKSGSETKPNVLADGVFQEDFDIDPSPGVGTLSRFSRTTRTNNPDDDLRIRNVKKAHQMQEIGEFQEMDDDVEYILDTLKSQNPIATRSLAAIQLASKCMTPAFRMHVRAHGTATKFFSALHDATENQSLGLGTATIMFVLIQDNLNMDLDKHSLELMLNLLDSDISRKSNYRETGLSDDQTQRNELKVIEICREIKNQGKAEHLNLENISIGTLAMETLLTLTSKRAGEWFKDEMRTLGGLEHIINTICECCKEISDCVIEWNDTLLEKLKKIERCLRVLENVSDRNEDNQKYILYFRNGEAVDTLSQLYKLCVSEIELNPTDDTTPTGAPGIVLREALVPLLKVLINLTHTFNRQPKGAVLFGEKPIVFETCFNMLFQTPQYIPDKCIFELSLLVLLLLINLSGHTSNRTIILDAQVSSDIGNKRQKVPGVRALIEFFHKYEELARFVEQNTDDILNNPEKCDKNKTKNKSQEDVEETVSKLLQKAGNHMEHTFLASYVCLLVGHLIMEEKDNESKVRMFLSNQSFADMIKILETYYNFMNLTASSEAIQVAHMKETKRIIQFMKESDQHSNEQMVDTNQTAEQLQQPHLANTSEKRWASSSSSNTSGGTSSNLFNKLCNSGR